MCTHQNIPAPYPLADTGVLSLVLAPGLVYDRVENPPQGVLREITDVLAAALQPDKIFLSDGYYREAPVQPDLLIVLPDSSELSFDECHLAVAAGYPRGVPFTYSLHIWHDIHRYLLEGHIFYSAVCTPANLLYNAGALLPPPLQARTAAIREQARRDFYDGLAKGEAFLGSAWHAYGREDNGITAFLLQQAVELPLRALLLALTGQALHTHSISKLCGCCRRCAPQLAPFFPEDAVHERRLMALLDNAYIYGRYRPQFLPAKTDLLLLFEKIKVLHLTMRELFEQRIAAFAA